MDNIYIYDETFIDLLNLINYLIKNKIKPDNIKSSNYYPSLLENIINLNLDNNIDINHIITNIGNDNFNIIFHTFLSEENNKELIIYYYYLNSIKYKENIKFMRNLKCVSEALRISKYVRHEAHKYKGFTRFKELANNILYAEIEPTNNILFLISKHFKLRLINEYWIIKDVKRNMFCIYDKNNYNFLNGDNFKLLDKNLNEKELYYESLWKEFYKTIGIETRKNDRCRMNFMPKKYWKYIIEMSEEI